VKNVIQQWLIVIGIIHIILFFISLMIFVPKTIYKSTILDLYQLIIKHFTLLLLIIIIGAFHIFEVNILDSTITNMIGIDFAYNIQMIEGDIVYQFSQYWTPALASFFVFVYIILYPFTLWFSPLYFVITDQKKSLKTFAYGLILIYAIALPFYLFFPVTNVYTFYGLESALENVIPSVEHFFYSVTTQNNCFPWLTDVICGILLAFGVFYILDKIMLEK